MASSSIEGEQSTFSAPRMGSMTTIDYSHPLYLSPSDGLGSLPVGIQLVGLENYMLWSRTMRIALLGINKLGFVDRSITREAYGPTLGHL